MASRAEIINEIEALEAHCRPPLMPAEVKGRWLQDWCADLADFPIEFVRAAIRDWRQGQSTKFPTPGQLLPMIRAKVPEARDPALVPRAWEPLSDAEYAALSLREKIRHQTILAQEARRKAGPMFRNTTGGGRMHRPTGVHLTEDDMPASYRRWTAIAEGHEAEAKRLREHIHDKPRLAAE